MTQMNTDELGDRAPIQLNSSYVVLDDDSSLWTSFGARFAAEHVVRLPRFAATSLTAMFDRLLPDATFSTRVEQGREIEQTLDDGSALGLWAVTLNDPALFGAIRRITGCPPIGCFTGRVYQRRVARGGDHYYPWHSDVQQDRLIGLSINLSREPYEGGVLQIRDAGTGRRLAEVANPVRGDAVLFRISDALEHQVTPVTAGGPRLVLAGWFRGSPDFRAVLKATAPVRTR